MTARLTATRSINKQNRISLRDIFIIEPIIKERKKNKQKEHSMHTAQQQPQNFTVHVINL